MKIHVYAAVAAGCLSIGTACAEDFTWTGSAGDGNWSNGANWGGTAPGAADTAIFTKAATVTPPPSFAGVLQVKGAIKVTANIGEATRFKLLMDNVGGTFEKGGTGDLTLSAAYGILKGKIVAAAGKLLLAGNVDDAPGAFDSLTVKAGASAEVVESPIETCHGAVYRVGSCAAGATYDADGYRSFYVDSTFVKFLAGWPIDSDKYIDAAKTRATGIYVPDEGEAALDGAKGYPEGFRNYTTSSGDLVLLFRAIVLNETEATRTSYLVLGETGGKGTFSCFYNGAKVYNRWPDGSNFRGEPISTASSKGWCAMDLLLNSTFDKWRNDSYPYYTCTPVVEGGHEKLTRNVLWCGVCFNAVTVEEGASLTVNDGQALAISNARGFKMDGAFGGATANTYLYLGSDWSVASGDARLSAKALRDFPGTVEIAPTSSLADDPGAKTTVPYNVIGTGELTVTEANKAKIGGFAGSIVVGENTSYEIQDKDATHVLTEKAELQPLSDSTWNLTGNAAFVNEGTAVEILKKERAAEQGYRSAVIGKTGIPVYCPFEFSCDVYMTRFDGYKSWYVDFNFGLFVQAEGQALTYDSRAWDSRSSCMLPKSKQAFGVCATPYSTCNLAWITNTLAQVSNDDVNAEKAYIGSATPTFSWSYVSGKPMRWTLKYDGFGTFSASVQTNAAGGVLTTQYTYPQLREAKYAETVLYPSVLARESSASLDKYNATHFPFEPPVISNVSFKVRTSASVLERVHGLEKNASLTVKGGQIDAAAGTPANAFADLTLADGATLSYAPYWTGLVSGLDLTDVTVTGAATATPAANESLTTTVGDLTSRNGGKLTVTGPVAVKTPLAVSVSRAELKAAKGPVTVLDVSGASPTPVVDLSNASVVDLDDSGKRIELEYVNGLLKANACFGTYLLVR